jgi:hypothetical protein
VSLEYDSDDGFLIPYVPFGNFVSAQSILRIFLTKYR